MAREHDGEGGRHTSPKSRAIGRKVRHAFASCVVLLVTPFGSNANGTASTPVDKAPKHCCGEGRSPSTKPDNDENVLLYEVRTTPVCETFALDGKRGKSQIKQLSITEKVSLT